MITNRSINKLAILTQDAPYSTELHHNAISSLSNTKKLP